MVRIVTDARDFRAARAWGARDLAERILVIERKGSV